MGRGHHITESFFHYVPADGMKEAQKMVFHLSGFWEIGDEIDGGT